MRRLEARVHLAREADERRPQLRALAREHVGLDRVSERVGLELLDDALGVRDERVDHSRIVKGDRVPRRRKLREPRSGRKHRKAGAVAVERRDRDIARQTARRVRRFAAQLAREARRVFGAGEGVGPRNAGVEVMHGEVGVFADSLKHVEQRVGAASYGKSVTPRR